ncbi:MAG: glycosyltransferase family 39 protein [Pseudomonadales bacterium]|nr:glycosyltransferase family 39 protein [Pseudomonadales bacterium]
MSNREQNGEIILERASWAIFLLIAALAVFLRFDTSSRIYHVDAILVTSAVNEMVEGQHWDSSWKHFRRKAIANNPEQIERSLALNPELIHELDEDQYNLSGYITFCAALVKLANHFGLEIHPNTLIRQSSLVFELTTLLLLFLIGKQYLGNLAALGASGIYAIVPLTVQAAHYIRPEAMLDAIYILLLYFSLTWAGKPKRNLIFLSLLCGAAFACKYSQIAIAMVPATGILYSIHQQSQGRWSTTLQQTMQQIPPAIVFFLLGAFIFAPYIFLNFSGYLEGMPSVLNAYKNPVPPNRLLAYSYSGQMLYYAQYFVQTFGLVICALFLTGLHCIIKKNTFLALLTITPVIVYFLFFCSTAAFFERSFNPVMAYFCLIAGSGIQGLFQLTNKAQAVAIRHALKVVFFVLLLAGAITPLKLSYIMANDYMGKGRGEARLSYQKALIASHPGYWIKNVDPSFNFLDRIPPVPARNPLRIYAITDYHDPWTEKYLDTLKQSGFIQVGEYRSPFFGQVPNNLTITHEAGRYLYFIRPDIQEKTKIKKGSGSGVWKDRQTNPSFRSAQPETSSLDRSERYPGNARK